MKNPELFKRTVDVLVKALAEKKIEHGSCTSCAVGNLVCASMYGNNEEAFRDDLGRNSYKGWLDVFCTDSDEKSQEMVIENYKNLAKLQIDSTGYSVGDLAIIEYAFETAPTPNYEEPADEEGALDWVGMNEKQRADWEVSGLRNVYDALLAIHDAKPEEVTPVDEVFPWPTI